MLHTKFRGNWSTGSGKDFLKGDGGHLGHVTHMQRTNFHSPYPWKWLLLAKWFWRRCLKIVDGRTTTDGRTPEHGYTISSPSEPAAQVSENACMNPI